MSSAKLRPFCFGLNVLTWVDFKKSQHISSKVSVEITSGLPNLQQLLHRWSFGGGQNISSHSL